MDRLQQIVSRGECLTCPHEWGPSPWQPRVQPQACHPFCPCQLRPSLSQAVLGAGIPHGAAWSFHCACGEASKDCSHGGWWVRTSSECLLWTESQQLVQDPVPSGFPSSCLSMRPCVGSAHLTPHFTNGLTQARAPLLLPKVPPCLVSAKEGITASKELVAYFLNWGLVDLQRCASFRCIA